jgi:hypothetical protein
MALRIARGLFRLWLVLSVLWIGLSVYILEPTTYRLPWLWRGAKFTYSTPTKAKEQFDLSRTQAQLSEDVTEALKREIERLKISDKSAADERLQALSADRDELLASMTEGYEQAKQKARIAWLITLVPPAGMLVLGLCAAWISRGFRPAAPKG